MRAEPVWEHEESVLAEASDAFAWAWCTAVGNWDDPPARFEFEGPFEAGAEGSTVMPGQEPVRWWIDSVDPGKSYVMATDLAAATLLFEWSFERVSEDRTLLRQRVVLSGARAADYVDVIAASFGENLAAGMDRIATRLSAAYRAAQPSN